jgi:predicted ATP-dependent Lon-type protease
MGKQDAELLLRLALELRLRVRRQLHQINPQEFPLTEFGYVDRETGEKKAVGHEV